MNFLTLTNVSKIFPEQKKPALENISAHISSGKIIGVVGPDGAGKTTLLRLIDGLLLPSQGEIKVEGQNTATHANVIHEFTGYMPQKFGLYEDLTVQQNLNLYADLRDLVKEKREIKFTELLHFTGLKPFTNRLAGALSGGMKQKLGLACALLSTPKVLLLDEPSVGVDPLSRRELWKMVQQLIKEDVSVVWSTAYLDEAEKCDQVLLFNDGKLLFNGKPSDLTEKVKGRTFKITHIGERKRIVLVNVLSDHNVLDGVIQGSDIRLLLKGKTFDLANVHAGKEAVLEETPPRFEDAFVDMLGGGPGGTSGLAQMTKPAPLKKEPVVEAIHLTKKFGSFTAADDISFRIHSGEIFGLLGPNGAGKSTTFKMMCGLLTPTHGQAFINGLDLSHSLSEARSHIGYMAQKFSLYSNLSVLQNLQFFAGIYNLWGSDKKKKIQTMIDIFFLHDYLDQLAGDLPLGFKQRLALACCVMHTPEVLFLDEPTSGVDPITRREFWNHINGLVEKNVTIMVTTHFMEEAEYCDRIGLIYKSKMIQMGTPDELKKIAKTSDNPHPTLEDAFVTLIENYDREHGGG